MTSQYVQRPLPKQLERLAELAFDLRLIGSKTMSQHLAAAGRGGLEPLQQSLTWSCRHAHQELLEQAAADEALDRANCTRWLDRQEHYMQSPGLVRPQHANSELKGVAYFSMEFGLSEALPIYSGGLGILAGDHLKSASDLNVPVVGIGLLYQQGYFRQVLADDGWQLEAFPFNDPGEPAGHAGARHRRPLAARADWSCPGERSTLRVWRAQVGKVNLYLLDSNHPLNSPWDRGITANLYAAGKEKRLLQEIVLGVGGWRLLEKLGIDVAGLPSQRRSRGLRRAGPRHELRGQAQRFRSAWRCGPRGRATCSPPTRRWKPPSTASSPAWCMQVRRAVRARDRALTGEQFLALGRTRPARTPTSRSTWPTWRCAGSCHANGVARLHGTVSQRPLPRAVPRLARGGGPRRVTSPTACTCPRWHSEPANQLWTQAYGVDGPWLGNVGAAAKGDRAGLRRATLGLSRRGPPDARRVRAPAARSGICASATRPRRPSSEARRVLDPNVAHARLRPPLHRLQAAEPAAGRPRAFRPDPAATPSGPMQIVVAGKAHPDDDGGKAMIQQIAQFSRREPTSAAAWCSWRTTTWCWPSILRRASTCGSTTPAGRPRPAAPAA